MFVIINFKYLLKIKENIFIFFFTVIDRIFLDCGGDGEGVRIFIMYFFVLLYFDLFVGCILNFINIYLFLCVLGFFKRDRINRICRYLGGDLLWELVLCDYGGWEVL